MTSWLKRTQTGIPSAPKTPYPGSALIPITTNAGPHRDPNAPDCRLECESKCIYERCLPGNAYITAHVTRLQDGFYNSPVTHGEEIDNVRFLAVNLVFHPCETINRFQAATVSLTLHDDTNQLFTDPLDHSFHRASSYAFPVPCKKPRFIRFAPHVLFGGVSPETLDWNFNLTGNLGVTQGPANASITPGGGVKGSYKLYQMMRIQGSTRTARARHLDGSGYDLEDGEVVWTMEENALQKSGLPREMTFVMLLTKGDVENVVLDIKIEPRIATWYGHYPKWWFKSLKYQPFQKDHLDLDKQLGQAFYPEQQGKGFNFANLAGTFNDFVSLPGTTFSLTDQAFRNQISVPDATDPSGQAVALAAATAASGNAYQQQGEQMSQLDPARSQSVPPQHIAHQSSTSENGLTDYHIYLHNPRSINLHATPPPPAASAPPRLPNLSNPLHASDPVPRPGTTVPSEQRSVPNPANTSLKRRSIDITNIGKVVSPSHLQSAMRNTSGGSLRRSRSRTDLRSSPPLEDLSSHSSDGSQISALRSPARRSRSVKVTNGEHIPPQTTVAPHSPEVLEEDMLIPMEAPSPPRGSSSVLSPPIPSSFSPAATPSKSTRLPFEMRRNHSDKDRVSRAPRSHDSSSPMRKQREFTPSPSNISPEAVMNSGRSVGVLPGQDEIIDMRTASTEKVSLPALEVTKDGVGPPYISSRRERTAVRDISPYAYATTNGLKEEEEWDDSKGDLKKMRARKRLSLPATAHYSYITAPPELSDDRDWDDR